MSTITKFPPQIFKDRVEQVFTEHYNLLTAKTDRFFIYLLIFQWALGIVFALTLSPQTWEGGESRVHAHVYAAIFLGGLLVSYPALLVYRQPGAVMNRQTIAVVQMLFSTLFIHLTGGRIETHFHIFGSLAFLAFYRDWKVLLIASVVTTLDHLVRGFFWPESVYGVITATPWRAFEHAGWVLFEDVFLFYSIHLARGELRAISESQVGLEETIATIEDKVIERTRELNESQQVVLEQQQALIASSKMSALGEMAGGVAHEINTPLATIKILSEQIQDNVNDDTEIDKKTLKEVMSVIELTTDRIARIVKGLRSFSRDGSRDPYEQVGLQSLIDETLSFCSERFKSDGTELKFAHLPKEIYLQGRRTELSQVLLNLLNNAHDAIQSLPEKWIQLEVVDQKDSVLIHLIDSGNGIPQSVQNKIFQPFFTTKEIGKGTGLGLSISSGIIHSHRGSLYVDSKNPHTCFVIKLPKNQDAQIIISTNS